MAERSDFVPSHVGDNILPADPLFNRLLALAHRPVQSTVLRDVNTNEEKTAAELLSDVLNLRKVLQATLAPSILHDINNGKETFISVLAPGGYEFAVGILSVFALGAAASPFSPLMPVGEATYYINKARSVGVMVSTSARSLGESLQSEIKRTTNPTFQAIPIASYKLHPPTPAADILLSSNPWVSPNSSGVIIFTSGTTGPPKAAVLPRSAITDGALSWATQLGLSSADTSLHLLPVHHATGIWVNFFPMIQVGACIEFKSGSFSPSWTWDRFRNGDITVFSGVPTIYMRMMRYWQETLSKLPTSEKEAYLQGLRKIRLMICGTSALPQPIDQFWTALRAGSRIVQRYGSTEQGVVFNMPFSPAHNALIPDGSVGPATMGVDVQLAGVPSNEDGEGEVLCKSPQMFSKYLHDPAATRAAHDENGYFKSGDMARREGKYYYITGRASVDIIKSGGYKISALDIERELLSLPYVSEAMVVGVPDMEFGQRVAAVVTLRQDQLAQKFYAENGRRSNELKISDLRNDARNRLAGYKLPTLLRVLEEEIPKSPTGKVVKKTLGPEYFPTGEGKHYNQDAEVQTWKNDGKAKL
jgi:malonyl-CoA/methylmalonyl-CoA synthetase